MGVQVSFNYAAWIQLFPQFNGLTAAQAQNWFNLATTFHRNDGGGPVEDVTAQTNLLNLLTAHIAQLMAPSATTGTQPGRDPTVVGRISSASEGSVSVSVENQSPPTAAWYMQTQYGAMYYTASAPYRTARYFPVARRPTTPIFPGLGWPSGW
jgi:Protein of unknown function (DUF4054)